MNLDVEIQSRSGACDLELDITYHNIDDDKCLNVVGQAKLECVGCVISQARWYTKDSESEENLGLKETSPDPFRFIPGTIAPSPVPNQWYWYDPNSPINGWEIGEENQGDRFYIDFETYDQSRPNNELCLEVICEDGQTATACAEIENICW